MQTTPPSFVEPEALVKGLQYLQERIPEFTQLTVREKRSHARAANLDPEFVENGLHAARVWRQTKLIVKRTGEELGEEQEVIRRWDEVIRDLRAFTDGIEAANVKRKHRLGTAILQIYRMLGIYLHPAQPEEAYMRPYYENMKRAYLRTQQFRRRKNKDEPDEGRNRPLLSVLPYGRRRRRVRTCTHFSSRCSRCRSWRTQQTGRPARWRPSRRMPRRSSTRNCQIRRWSRCSDPRGRSSGVRSSSRSRGRMPRTTRWSSIVERAPGVDR